MKFSLRCLAVVVASFLLLSPLSAQTRDKVWYFGTSLGLDFKQNPPLLLHDGALETIEGTASITDLNGNILFYTDGVTVYNREHRAMPNGTDLFGHRSSSQSAIIVPIPSSATLYYIFTIDQTGYAGPNKGLNYSIVDITLDGGLGDVTSKNINLAELTSEQLGVAIGCDNETYWVIAHKLDTEEFLTWKVTEDGVATVPVASQVGSMVPSWGGIGRLSISPNVDMVAVCYNNAPATAELFQFDDKTGKLSNPIIVREIVEGYGCAFSPLQKRIFFTGFDSIDYYDITVYDSATIVNSRRSIPSAASTLQLGPDNNIYVKSRDILGRIEDADGAVIFTPVMYDLSQETNFFGLPTFPVILPPTSRELQLQSIGFSQIPSCLTLYDTLILSQSRCGEKTIVQCVLEDDDDVFSIDTLGSLPFPVQQGNSLRIPVTFSPTSGGQFKSQLRIFYYDHNLGGILRDTVITIEGSAEAKPQLGVSMTVVQFPQSTLCQGGDTVLTITNNGCDTLSITDVTLIGDAYSLSDLPTPFPLPPNSSINVTIGFHSNTADLHLGSVQITALQEVNTRRIDVSLSGVVAEDDGRIEAISILEFTERTICAAVQDTFITFRNTGCDTLLIKNTSRAGDNDYTLLNGLTNVILPPDSIAILQLSFIPIGKGTRTGTVTLTWSGQHGGTDRETQIALSTLVIDGSRVLSSSLSTIDFGETTICEERDTTITFVNIGCDSLTIEDVEIDRNFRIETPLPIVLAPGESVELEVITLLDTIGTPLTLSGTLTVTSNADQVLPPVSFTRQLFYPTRLRIEAIDPASGSSDDIVRFRIILEGDVPQRMTALHFDFLHDNDVLSFASMIGQGLTITNTSGISEQRQSFTLSPVRSGVLGEVSFRPFLAEQEQAILSFDNIRFDAEGVTFAPECIAIISDSGTVFTYADACGDKVLREYLRDDLPTLTIIPNPAQDEIRIDLKNITPPSEIAIYDQLGREVLRTGTYKPIDVTTLPGGTYYISLNSDGKVFTRKLLIDR